MAQVKIYGHRAHLDQVREAVSDAVHACAVEVLGLPKAKRFQRFIGLDPGDFVYPDDRSDRYTIIEVLMFEGRSVEIRKRFIRALFAKLESSCGLAPDDVEITIVQAPRHDWGIRGVCGDELVLGYEVNV